MPRILITADHVKNREYIGETGLSNWPGDIEIASDLGRVHFFGRVVPPENTEHGS